MMLTREQIVNRLKRWLPQGWSGSDTPVLDAVLNGGAAGAEFNYEQLGYVQAQMRVQTATGENLDAIAQDYFGSYLNRLPEESDGAYRLRILANLQVDSQTRAAITSAILQLTGLIPVIWEPFTVADNGAYGVNLVYGRTTYAGGEPYWYHITVFRRSAPFLDVFGAYGNGLVYGGPGAYLDPYFFGEYISDAAIIQVLDRLTAAGVKYDLTIIDV